MHAAWRIGIGITLVGLAVVLVLISCRWGTDLDAERVLMLPGISPPTGLFAAEWTGDNPFFAMFLGITMPVLLVTAAMWTLVRIRS
ncbi:MAG: hypothetical protein QF438_00830 [Phycisphaerales bacterium]|jgi:hypothetical protein|nr:hypothetical protein [Phycisphaerales bacterium]